MKNSTYENFVKYSTWIAYGLTLFLSIYAVYRIMNVSDKYWILVAISGGLIVNTAEMISWYKRNRLKKEADRLQLLFNRAYTENDKAEIRQLLSQREVMYPLLICLFMAFLSIGGSFFSLQSGYNRGKEIANIHEKISEQLLLNKDLIREYKANASESRDQAHSKRNLSNMYLNKSDNFLEDAKKLLGSNSKELDYLKSTLENKVSLGIFDSYTTLFGGNPTFWAAFFNCLLALLFETAFLFFGYESYHIYNPRAYISELGEREVQIKKAQIKEPELVPAMQTVSANEVQNLTQINSKDFAQKNDGNGAKTQTGKLKRPIGYEFAPTANKKKKRKNNNNDLHRKICYEYTQQEAQIKEGLRKVFNITEIANNVQTTRQNVDYHLRKENLKD